MSSQIPPRLWARIDDAGLLSVEGLPDHPDGFATDHDAPENAYAELVNLALDLAQTVGDAVWLHADTPTGSWAMAIHSDGTTVPLPTELLDPDPSKSPPTERESLTDLEAALAAVGGWDPPPAAVVLALAADPAVDVRAAATAELSTWGDDSDVVVEADLTAEQLAALADCPLGWIRAGVAGHPRADRITLDRLARDQDALVVQALAGRLDLPAELATTLASHSEPVVRAELGRNPAAAFLIRSAPGVPTGVAVMEVAAAEEAPPKQDSPMPTHPGPALPNRGGRRVAGGVAATLILLGGSAAMWRAADAASPAPTATTPVVAWQGTWLPTGPDGPSDPAAPNASGFSHTELGAAMAAAHLGVRIDAYAGPSAFRPTITRQTYGGDPAKLLARTEAAYRRAAAASGVSTGEPIPTSPGRIIGWRTNAWHPDGPVTIHLLVSTASGGQLDFAIEVTWVDGDYRLVDPTREETFVTSADPDPRTYTPF